MTVEASSAQYAFIRSAASAEERADAVTSVFEAEIDRRLDRFYEMLAANPELAGHVAAPGLVEQLKAAQRRHWARVFAERLPPDLAEKAAIIGSIHAESGLPSSWYTSAYAWMLVGMIEPLVSAFRFRPGKLVAALETLLSRAFLDMIASTTAHDETINRINAEDSTRENNLANLRSLSGTVADVNEVAVELAFLARNSRELNSSAQTIASAVTEMVASVDEIARSSEGAVADTRESDGAVSKGRAAVDQVDAAIGNIARAVEETAASVDELSRASEQIGQILGVIETIASQTNLLALNATIEAARAGEVGRGFAVVAAEVKGLSNQTSRATEDITARIGSLREGMTAILTTMQHSKTAVVEGQRSIVEAGRTMDDISAKIAGVGTKMRAIASVLGQQTAATGEIGRSVDQVAATAEANEALLGRMSSKLHESNDRVSDNAKTWFQADSHRALVEMAKIDHVLFKKRVVDVLMGRGAWQAAEVPDHHDCRLGKWYDGLTIPEIRNDPTFSALIAPHQAVHAEARRTLALHAEGRVDEAAEALAAMNAASEEVLARLAELSDNLFRDLAAIDRRRQERRRARGRIRARVGGAERVLEVKDISPGGARLDGLTRHDLGKEVQFLDDGVDCCSGTAVWANDREGGMKFSTRPTASKIRRFVAD
jgi:methyl-accepting chemotaxis protein